MPEILEESPQTPTKEVGGHGRLTLQSNPLDQRSWPVIAVAGEKGGTGKTLIAYELAGSIGAVVIDLDWQAAGVTNQWGLALSDWTRRKALITALRSCTLSPNAQTESDFEYCLTHPPTALIGPVKPGLVPYSPSTSSITGMDSSEWREMLISWTRLWQHPIVLDTHSGVDWVAAAAAAAADLVVTPLVLRRREIRSVPSFLNSIDKAARVVLVPTRRTTPRWNSTS